MTDRDRSFGGEARGCGLRPRNFLGPVWPAVGPNYNEPVERFRREFLERECRFDPRVARYLARLSALDEVPEKLVELEEKLKQFERPKRQWMPRKKASDSRREGVPL